MKKILLSIAMVAISLGAFAQENSAEGLRWKGIMNNSFWSNWEIGVNGGINVTSWDGVAKNQKTTGDRGWQIGLDVTKWYNPIVGTRVAIAGGELNKSNKATNSNWMMFTSEGLINLSNWIGGYREDRVYYAKVFAGFGVNALDFDVNNSDNDFNTSFVATSGLINTFRVCPALDINLELKSALLPGRDMPSYIASQAGKYGQIYSATLGLTYRFNKRNWDKAYSQEEVDGYLAAIAALEAGLADAHRNNGKLAERLAAQKAATDKALKDLEECLKSKKPAKVSGSTALFFNLNSARLLDRTKASMQLLAEDMKAAPADQVFTLVGHADVKTGTAEYNQKLSEKRAKAVYDYLIEQGVNKDQLTWKGVGSTENIFPANNTNRVVIVK